MVQVASVELRRRRILERTKPDFEPKFKIGDNVVEQSHNKLASITLVYTFENQYRYVIRTDDGGEFVCFEHELKRLQI
jgi:hypothetical protein